MGAIASQITSFTIVYSMVYSGADQRKHQSSASLAFLRGIHRGPVNAPHKWPVTRKMFSFDDVIICYWWWWWKKSQLLRIETNISNSLSASLSLLMQLCCIIYPNCQRLQSFFLSLILTIFLANWRIIFLAMYIVMCTLEIWKLCSCFYMNPFALGSKCCKRNYFKTKSKYHINVFGLNFINANEIVGTSKLTCDRWIPLTKGQ